jgi:hypothetical protein
MRRRPVVTLDGQRLPATQVGSDRSWIVHFRKEGLKWQRVDSAQPLGLAKRHGLQGPIDDAFMDSFVFVKPSGKCASAPVQAWVDRESAHAIEHWRRQFRGRPRVKLDSEITSDDVLGSNLILWGDPQSNQVLAKIVDRLPLGWKSGELRIGNDKFNAAGHVPLLIYPNPLNPQRYLVLNSGFTFREYDYLNNARQTPKLPDIAIVDVSVPATSRTPGKIAAAGFFDESWRPPAHLDTK